MKISKKRLTYLSKLLEGKMIDSMTKYRVAEELETLGIKVNLDTCDIDTETIRFLYKVMTAHIVTKHRGEDGQIAVTVQRKISDVGRNILR